MEIPENIFQVHVTVLHGMHQKHQSKFLNMFIIIMFIQFLGFIVNQKSHLSNNVELFASKLRLDQNVLIQCHGLFNFRDGLGLKKDKPSIFHCSHETNKWNVSTALKCEG